MQLKLTVDLQDVTKRLTALERQQIPFATVLALTATGDEVQRVQREQILRRFEIRRKQFILNTVKRTHRPTKTEPWYTLEIDPARDMLAKFERGGFKTSIGGRPYIAIPLPAIQPSKSRVIPKHNRPAAFGPFRDTKNGVAVGKRGALILPTRGGNRLLVERIGSAKTSRALGRAGMRALYLFVPRVRIDARLEFDENARAVVAKAWAPNFTRALDRALRTAR